jgi:cytochrome b-561 domain-containing protein 2
MTDKDSVAVNMDPIAEPTRKLPSPATTPSAGPLSPSPAVSAIVTLVRRTVSICAMIYMMNFWLSVSWKDVFQYHPLTMTAAFVAAMPETLHSALSIRRARSMNDRVGSSRRHLILSTLMSVLTLIGYAAIYYNKDQRKKQHLKTWHGLFGFVTVCVIVVQALCGLVVYFKLTKDGNKLALIRKIHKYCGIAVMALGCLSMWLGLQSNFALGAVASPTVRIVFGLVTTVVTASSYVIE